MRVQKIQRLIMVAVLAGATGASAVDYTSEASFLGAINPSYYLNDFNDITGWQSLGSSDNYSGDSGTFAYTVTAPTEGIWGVVPGGNGAVSTVDERNPLTISFTSGNVTAIGGLFFLTDEAGNAIDGTVQIKLSDSTSQTFAAGSFHGFVLPQGGPAITSLSFMSLTAGDYPTLDHFYAGSSAPVPDGPAPMIAAALLLPLGANALGRLFKKHAAPTLSRLKS
jgi:hypothetical protein